MDFKINEKDEEYNNGEKLFNNKDKITNDISLLLTVNEI